MAGEPTYFATPAAFRDWLETNQKAEAELLVGFWKKGSGRPSVDWPQARDQALCFGWIDGVRRSLGDEAYTIRFTPRRKDSIWSKVNVERFHALTDAGMMTPAGERAFQAKGRSGIYAYENELKKLTGEETKLFQANADAWADWEGRPPGYRKIILNWITTAKKPETRARRLATLIEDSAAGRKVAGYDAGRKP